MEVLCNCNFIPQTIYNKLFYVLRRLASLVFFRLRMWEYGNLVNNSEMC
jgi:hypothetical protein